MSFTNKHIKDTSMNSRSKTLPCFPSNTSDKRRSTSTSHAVPANYFLPTPTKESLEEWLYKSTNTNTTNTTTTPPHSLSPGYSLLEVCYCCEQSDCKSLVSLNKTMRKLESETRLAAEIGQSLLQKHEAHVLDTNHRTQALKNQLNTAHEKVAQLEQSLEESENSKQEVLHECKRYKWEYQKAEKILKETVADLETVNAKCTQLTQDLDVKYSQVEKLQVFKLMVRQADIREETLRCKLEDMSQELAVSRKHELMLEAKQKKLLSKFEAMSIVCDQMRTKKETEPIPYNRKITPTAITTVPKLQPWSMEYLLDLVREISSTHSKYKTDLNEEGEHTSSNETDTQPPSESVETEESLPWIDINSNALPESANSPLLSKSVPSLYSMVSTGFGSTDKEISGHPRKSPLQKEKRTSSPVTTRERKPGSAKGKDTIRVKPTINTTGLSSLPVRSIVHHHYHYHAPQSTDLCDKDKLESSATPTERHPIYNDTLSEKCSKETSPPTPTLLLPESKKDLMDEQRAPYHELHFYVSQTLQRLVATDIRALNRRLRRTFDIFELSSMSNSIIENILVDIDALGTRFLWVQEEWEESPKESSSTFYLVLHLFQMLLQAMGQLRATMNELQVEYVSKVEEYRQRVEEEMDQKRETMDQKALLKSSPFSPTSRTPPAGPLSWISHVFQRKGHPHQHIMTSPRMGRSISYESIVPRYTHDPAMTVAKAPKTSTRNMGHHDLAEEQQRPKTAGFEKDRQSGKVDIRRVKSSICQYGPVSCYSRSVVSGDKATPRIPYPIVRASKSTGTDRNARQVSSLGREVGQKQKSPLRHVPSSFSYDALVSRPSGLEPNGNWKVGTPFSTSWLGSR